MSMEYFGTPSPQMDQTIIRDVIDRIAKIFGDSHADHKKGIITIGHEDPNWESATIQFGANEVYIAIHALPRDERAYLLAVVEGALLEKSIHCCLKEE